MKKKKAIILASSIIIIAVAGILTYVLWPERSKEAGAVQLNTATVTKGNILVSVDGSGSVSAINSESVRTKEAGEVDQVKVAKGDVVKKGDVLLTFVGDDREDDLKKAAATLKTLEKTLRDKQESYKELALNQGSDDELEAAKTAIENAEQDIADQQDTIASIQEETVPNDPLTAPIDGTITAVNITDGEQATNGSELFTMTDYDNLAITVQVDELDIPSVKPGMPATVTLDALADQSFTGKVIEIGKEGTSSNGVSLFDVKIGLDKSEGVLVGMSAEVSVTIQEKNDILTVPIEAVSERNGAYYVNVPVTDTVAGESEAAGVRSGGGGTEAEDTAAGGQADGNAPGRNQAAAGTETSGQASEGAGTGGQTDGNASGRDQAAEGAASNGQAFGETGTGGRRAFSGGQAPGAEMPSGQTYGGRQGARQGGGAASSSGQKAVEVKVGIHDETRIEITSGLSEGEQVVIPTVISTNSGSGQSSQQQGGFGGMGGSFGGMSGGGMSGGGGMSRGSGGAPGGGGGR